MKRIYKKEEKELYIFILVLSSIMSLCSLIFNLFLKELAKITSHHKIEIFMIYFNTSTCICIYRPCTHIVFILQCQKAKNNSQIV